jgi:catechol-2,3-dioxygenase
MLINIRSLDYVVLLCKDMGRMRAFYHEVLAFPFTGIGMVGWRCECVLSC